MYKLSEVILADKVLRAYNRYNPKILRTEENNHDPKVQAQILEFGRLKAFAIRYSKGIKVEFNYQSPQRELVINMAKQVLEDFCKTDPELKMELKDARKQ